jgi:hypothetical protein
MKISIGGIFQALLGTKAVVLSAKSADTVVEHDDNTIAEWLGAMRDGRPTAGNPLNIKSRDKIVTLRIRIGQDEIRRLFKGLDESQLVLHEEWLGDREVEDAADLLQADHNKPYPF